MREFICVYVRELYVRAYVCVYVCVRVCVCVCMLSAMHSSVGRHVCRKDLSCTREHCFEQKRPAPLQLHGPAAADPHVDSDDATSEEALKLALGSQSPQPI